MPREIAIKELLTSRKSFGSSGHELVSADGAFPACLMHLYGNQYKCFSQKSDNPLLSDATSE